MSPVTRRHQWHDATSDTMSPTTNCHSAASDMMPQVTQCHRLQIVTATAPQVT